MREDYGSNLCVRVCACYCTSDIIPSLHVYVQSEAAYSFLQAFKDLYCVDFAENVSFGRYVWHHLPAMMISDSLTKNTPMVLDMITNGIVHVYELLARSDDYPNQTDFL